MKCNETKKLMQEILDGKNADDKDVISHIGSCSNCAEEYKAIKTLKNILSFKEETVIPADFNARVWKKIGQPKPSLIDRIFGIRPSVSFAFKTAAAFAAVVFMVIMAKNSFINNETAVVASPKAQVKTVVAKIEKSVRKATGAKPCLKKETEAPAEVAIISVPENKNEVIKENESMSSPGKGPVIAANNITINLNAKEAPQAVKNEQPAGAVSAAGISKAPAAPTVTITKEEHIDGPVEIRNNVFNPAQGKKMAIKYRVGAASLVTIQVYNKKGEPIKTIVRELKQPGIYDCVWDGTTDSNIQAPAEVYIVYIKTDLTEKRVKAALVK